MAWSIHIAALQLSVEVFISGCNRRIGSHQHRFDAVSQLHGFDIRGYLYNESSEIRRPYREIHCAEPYFDPKILPTRTSIGPVAVQIVESQPTHYRRV